MCTNMQGAKLNYPTIDNQSFDVYKDIIHFRYDILKNHMKVIVPHPVVRSLFTQKELGDCRGNCVIAI
jgi:hypothetical protein